MTCWDGVYADPRGSTIRFTWGANSTSTMQAINSIHMLQDAIVNFFSIHKLICLYVVFNFRVFLQNTSKLILDTVVNNDLYLSDFHDWVHPSRIIWWSVVMHSEIGELTQGSISHSQLLNDKIFFYNAHCKPRRTHLLEIVSGITSTATFYLQDTRLCISWLASLCWAWKRQACKGRG